MTDGTSSNGGTVFAGHSQQNAHLVIFVHLQAHTLQFFPLWSLLWAPTRCYLQALISMGQCHHFGQDICWDHIISSYLSRLFTRSFNHVFFSFLFPRFVQGLKYSDSVISSSSLHFPQWFFSNNIVQNPNVWFPVFPPIKTSLSALSPKLFLLKFIICRKGFKSFCVCN